MSMDRVAMALDDVIKADRKDNKGKKAGAKAAKNNIKKAAGGIKKKNTPKKPAQKQQPAEKLVKKLVHEALVQNGVVQGKKAPRGRAQRKNAPATRTVVRKVVRKVVDAPAPRRRSVRRADKPLGMNQRSRTIVRRVVEAPARRQPRQTIVREVRYVRDPAPRERVVRRAAPASRRRVVVVEESPRARYGSVYTSSSRRPARRTNDPFYEPRNFLQRY